MTQGFQLTKSAIISKIIPSHQIAQGNLEYSRISNMLLENNLNRVSSLTLYSSNKPIPTKDPSPSSTPSSDSIEPKYIVALVVFLLACVFDKVTMHGGF